jgi:hypothetical protein
MVVMVVQARRRGVGGWGREEARVESRETVQEVLHFRHHHDRSGVLSLLLLIQDHMTMKTNEQRKIVNDNAIFDDAEALLSWGAG